MHTGYLCGQATLTWLSGSCPDILKKVLVLQMNRPCSIYYLDHILLYELGASVQVMNLCILIDIHSFAHSARASYCCFCFCGSPTLFIPYITCDANGPSPSVLDGSLCCNSLHNYSSCRQYNDAYPDFSNLYVCS